MSAFVQVLSSARLDWGEVVRSRWLAFTLATYVALAGLLVIFGMRESALFGFTGMERVLLSFSHLLLVVLPLLGLAATTQVVARAREDGTVELLFSHPLSRAGYLAGITAARYALLVLPLVAVQLALAALAQLAFHDAPSYAMAARGSLVGAALLWCFCGIGLAISVRARHQAGAVVAGLVVWALSVALLDLALVGVLLRGSMHARAVLFLAALNPVQAARLALLSGIDPSLAALGPVGFYAAEQLGAARSLALGVGWPLAVGTMAWLSAIWAFRRGDLV